MKTTRFVALLAATLMLAGLSVAAADSKTDPAVKKAAKPKPYILKTCLVADEKLGGDMGEPYTFTYKDREVKLCCKDCRKDFDKNPAKFIKKLEEAEKKAAASKSSVNADKK